MYPFTIYSVFFNSKYFIIISIFPSYVHRKTMKILEFILIVWCKTRNESMPTRFFIFTLEGKIKTNLRKMYEKSNTQTKKCEEKITTTKKK